MWLKSFHQMITSDEVSQPSLGNSLEGRPLGHHLLNWWLTQAQGVNVLIKGLQNSLFPQQSLSPKLINSFNMPAMPGCKDLNPNPLDKFQIVQGDIFYFKRKVGEETS